MKYPTKKQIEKFSIALRSGKYNQTKGSLQDKDGYCCLGVACKVFIPNDKLRLDFNGILIGAYPSAQENSPEWLKNLGDSVFNKKGFFSLVDLNDGELGLSFSEIADVLELIFIHKALD